MRLITMASKKEEIDVLDKDYKEPVDFTIGSGSDALNITWTPGTDVISNLYGQDEPSQKAAEMISEHIFDLYRESPGKYIAASPVGPFLRGTVDDLPTVVYVLNTVYGDLGVKASGDAPTMADLMLDESTNVDEDGNTVVR